MKVEIKMDTNDLFVDDFIPVKESKLWHLVNDYRKYGDLILYAVNETIPERIKTIDELYKYLALRIPKKGEKNE